MTQNKAHAANHVRIQSRPSELASVRKRVEDHASTMGFAEKGTAEIMLAVDEALANVIRHGYGGPCDKPIDIQIEACREAGQDAIRITIRDFGKQVDPSEIAGRPLEEVRPGGLGVHIIRSVMDEVTYSPAEGGGMTLVMRKDLKKP